MKRRLLVLALTAAAFLPGCSREPSGPAAGGKPVIVTTSTMVTDAVRALTNGLVEIEPLMAPGIDPHSFSIGGATAKLRRGTIFVRSGLHLEGKLDEVFDDLQKSGKKVITAASGLAAEDILKDESGAPDPHIWGSAALWAKSVKHIAAELAKALPEHAAAITERAAAQEKLLLETHDALQKKAATLPEAQRVLVTSHDAFQYFGKAYGFQLEGVQGISTVSEATGRDRLRVTALVKERGLTAIFVETSVNRAMIESIAADAGVKIGGELFSDSLGQPGDMRTIDGTPADTSTVPGMLRANLETIISSLR